MALTHAVKVDGTTTGSSGSEAVIWPVLDTSGAGFTAAAGDFAIVLGNVGAGSGVTMGFTGTGSGWTQRELQQNNGASTGKIGVWTKVLDSGDITSPPAVTSSASRQITWATVVVRGGAYDTLSVLDSYINPDLAFDLLSLTPSVADCLLVGLVAAASHVPNSARSAAPPSGYTERGEYWTISTSNRNGVEVSTQQLSGGSGTPTSTASGSFSGSVNGHSILLCVKPASTTYQVSGAVAGTSAVAGSVVSVRAASGQVDGTPAVAGAPVAARAATGSVAGTSAVSGAVTLVGAASGSVAGTSAVAGSVTGYLNVSGTVGGTSDVSGAAVRVRPVSGQVDAVSDVSGAAEIVAGETTYQVSGSVAGTSGVAGSVVKRGAASGTVSASSATAGAPTARLLVAASVAAVTGLAGAVTATQQVSGTVEATSEVAGSPASVVNVSGVVEVVSGVSGSVYLPGELRNITASAGPPTVRHAAGAPTVRYGAGPATPRVRTATAPTARRSVSVPPVRRTAGAPQ